MLQVSLFLEYVRISFVCKIFARVYVCVYLQLGACSIYMYVCVRVSFFVNIIMSKVCVFVTQLFCISFYNKSRNFYKFFTSRLQRHQLKSPIIMARNNKESMQKKWRASGKSFPEKVNKFNKEQIWFAEITKQSLPKKRQGISHLNFLLGQIMTKVMLCLCTIAVTPEKYALIVYGIT